MPVLSEYEFGLTMAFNAFSRWMVRCMTAAGAPGMSPLEVQVLHSVNHRNREKTLTDLCLLLDVEEVHNVAYALKKLEKKKLLESGKRGSEKTVCVTPEGALLCRRYREVREDLLVRTVQMLSRSEDGISDLSALLRGLSGTYDQAARAAAAA